MHADATQSIPSVRITTYIEFLMLQNWKLDVQCQIAQLEKQLVCDKLPLYFSDVTIVLTLKLTQVARLTVRLNI